jgi:hypothetical protein
VSRHTLRSLVVVLALGAPFTTSPASAQPMDERVFFTFSAPVELPGVVLPGGKYIFRLADPTSSHDVVQVLSGDGMKSQGIFFTVPAVRLEPAPKPEVRFIETAAGTPPAIRAYWNLADTIGHEFIYPKEQARRLAKASKEPVLTTAAQTTTSDQTNTGNIVRLSADGRETAVNASSKPAPSAPTGAARQGDVAPASIAIPRVVVVVVPAPSAR